MGRKDEQHAEKDQHKKREEKVGRKEGNRKVWQRGERQTRREKWKTIWMNEGWTEGQNYMDG